MPSGVLSLYLVVFADALLRDPELKPLPFRSRRFQSNRVSLFIHDIHQARHSPTSLVSVAELFSCSAR